VTWRLRRLAGQFAVCRWPEGAPIPEWVYEGAFWQVLQAPGECTLVCEAGNVPVDVPSESGWHVLKVDETLGFDLTGVLHTLLAPLAAHEVVVLALSGYSTDFLLVRDLEAAVRALRLAGHEVL